MPVALNDTFVSKPAATPHIATFANQKAETAKHGLKKNVTAAKSLLLAHLPAHLLLLSPRYGFYKRKSENTPDIRWNRPTSKCSRRVTILTSKKAKSWPSR